MNLIERKAWEKIGECLDQDLLTDAYSSEEIKEEIRKAGGDPEGIGKRGAALAHRLIDKLYLARFFVAIGEAAEMECKVTP